MCVHLPQPTTGGHISIETRINDRIRVPEVRLVGPAGEQIGIVRIEDALRLAFEADLDLVEVSPESKPPVCKLMDFGKFKYDAAVKARESRKNQVNTVIKEMKLRPKIDNHDYETKKGHILRFLNAGDKVKITIMFRGREQSRPELGYRLLQRLAADIGEMAVIESSPLQDGRNMTMVLAPVRKKTAPTKPAKPEAAAPVATPASAPAAPTAPIAPAPVAVEAPAPTPEPEVVVTPEPVVEVAEAPVKKAAVKKTAVKKATAKAAEPASEEAPVKKAAAKKAPAKKAATKEAATKNDES
ncbi:MAG: translation initiation factor IF-3 [Actinobacteria bacterium]|nr:translation initiation factor IF-3 [Actinomycetota bacterium]